MVSNYADVMIGITVGATVMFFVWQLSAVKVDRQRSRDKFHDFLEQYPSIADWMQAEAGKEKYYEQIQKMLEEQWRAQRIPVVVSQTPLKTILVSLWFGGMLVAVLGGVFAGADVQAMMILVGSMAAVLWAYHWFSKKPPVLEGPVIPPDTELS